MSARRKKYRRKKQKYFFDAFYYLKENRDVRLADIDPWKLCQKFGWKEGRNPSLLFDIKYYLNQNTDIRRAKINPLNHFIQFGFWEGRKAMPNADTYSYWCKFNADRKNKRFSYKVIRDVLTIQQSRLFDKGYYLSQYQDINDAFIKSRYWKMRNSRNPFLKFWGRINTSTVIHYVACGVYEGRNPNPTFSTADYVRKNIEFLNNGINPFVHYIQNETIDYGLNNSKHRSKGNLRLLDYPEMNNFHNRTQYYPFDDIQSKLLLTDQKFTAPYCDMDSCAIGFMESYQHSLVSQYQGSSQDIKVSIIMPTFNRSKIIGEAIQSVIKQTYQNWELIIIDDCSTDDTKKVIQKIKDPRIKYCKTETNLGSAGARNVGFSLVEGEFICYLDTDNQFEEDFLLIMTNESKKNPHFDILYCAERLYTKNPDDSISETGIRFAPFNRPTIENHNYLDINVLFHRKSVIEKIQFNHSMRRLADWEFILRTTETKPALSVPCILVKYFYKAASNQNTYVESYADAERYIRDYLCSKKIEFPNQQEPIGPINLYHSKTIPSCSEKYPVSIIIPNYNCLDYLKLCLQSVRDFSQENNYEIIIIDNKSDDKIVDFLKQEAKEKRNKVIFNEKNMGFTHAVNQGIHFAKPGNDIVLLNNDTIVTKYWLEAFQEVKNKYPTVGLIAPQQVVLPYEKTIQIHRPQCNSKVEIDINLTMWHGNIINPTFDTLNGYIELNFAPFFCIYISRDTINEVGLLDEMHGPHYYSDRFYCDLVRTRSQKKILYTPKSKVYHFVQRATQEIKQNDKIEFQDLMVKKW